MLKDFLVFDLGQGGLELVSILDELHTNFVECLEEGKTDWFLEGSKVVGRSLSL